MSLLLSTYVRNLFNGRRYRSRVSQSEPISASYECHMKCVENCNCLSYNVCNGGKLCELNPEKKENNISLYETSDTCDYYELGFNQKQSSDCKDQCCSTSKPCLNNGRCEATCMKNGRRFLCDCAEGQDGDQCESVARDCGFYANSANKTHGLRVIYAPDNTAYRAFCYFGNNILTLAMSFSVENQRLVSAPLSNDQPVFEDSHNWEEYRLGLARMTALRDGAYKWKYACAYDQLDIKDTDSVTIFLAKLDPLKVDGIVCSAAQSIRIYGETCPKCVWRAASREDAEGFRKWLNNDKPFPDTRSQFGAKESF
ncbi:uncharacterized protein LOC114530707 [Dendronephthya gigantea]|uniref:uncharacterized protein LOC114530707 n=1 Tax=Dendronephthya gigantea TaxID=151771 RepID=UPI0010699E4B|nr:uncharacterized protein LOC114530707 [Dendronephthya gigantea]